MTHLERFRAPKAAQTPRHLVLHALQDRLIQQTTRWRVLLLLGSRAPRYSPFVLRQLLIQRADISLQKLYPRVLRLSRRLVCRCRLHERFSVILADGIAPPNPPHRVVASLYDASICSSVWLGRAVSVRHSSSPVRPFRMQTSFGPKCPDHSLGSARSRASRPSASLNAALRPSESAVLRLTADRVTKT